jgi:hypothetical protein
VLSCAVLFMEEVLLTLRRRNRTRHGSLGILCALSLGLLWASGCATGEETTGDDWTPESGAGGSGASGAGGSGGTAETGGAAGESGSGGSTGGAGGSTGGTGGSTGGTGGSTGGTGGSTGGTGGSTGGTGGATGGTGGAVTPTCDDDIQNQGETGIDCGGPCPACGFTHQETFNYLPTWGPDGAYTIAGSCDSNASVSGWRLSNLTPASFPLAVSYYAVIDTNPLSYWGISCDDYLRSPLLDANGATTLSVEFDTDFKVFLSSTASVVVEADGVQQVVWSRSANVPDQRVTIGSINIAGKSQVRVLWRYQGSYEYHWMVDNVLIKGS